MLNFLSVCAAATALHSLPPNPAAPRPVSRAEVVEIARLAPAESWAFVSIPDWPAFVDAGKAAGLEGLWKEPSVREFVKGLFEDQMKELNDALESIDAKVDDLVYPRGGAGLAMFDAPAEDPELPDETHVLAAADFAVDADAAQDLLDRMIDRGLDQRRIEITEDDYGDAHIVAVTALREEAPAEEEPVDPEFPEMEEFESEPAGPFVGHDTVFLARLGSAFVACTDRAGLESALDALAGGDIHALGETGTFERTLAQHPRDAVACAGLMLGPLMSTLAEGGIPFIPFLPFGADSDAVLKVLGIGALESISTGLSPGAGDAVARQTVAVLTPEKRGLVSLFNLPDAPADPPAFVGADAAGFTRIMFNFGGVVPLLREVAGAFPAESRETLGQQIDSMAGAVGPLLETLGPEVYIATSYAMPLSAESQRQVFAIPLRDPLILNNILATFTAGVLEATDFQGNTIYRPAEGGLPGPAVGLGFGHVFIGPGAGVEAMMRQAANPGGPRLATEPRFRRAAAALDADPCNFVYSETEPELRWLHWQAENVPEADPEFPVESPLAALKGKLPPIEVLTRHLGDTVFGLGPSPDGFRGTLLWLRPAPK